MKTNTETLTSIKSLLAAADAQILTARDTIIKITNLLADIDRESLHDFAMSMQLAEDDERYYGIGGADAYSNH